MKKLLRFVGVVVSFAFVAAPLVGAEPKDGKDAKAKTPADLAYDEYLKVYDLKETKLGAARFQQLSTAAIKFIGENPKHKETPRIINRLVDYAGTMKGPDVPQRRVWFSTLQMNLFDKLFDESIPEENKTALMALDAAASSGLAMEDYNNDSEAKWRTKIDALAKQPSGWRYLKDREASFVEVLTKVSPKKAEAHVRKLIETGEKLTAAWAREELNLIETRKQPYELKFTGLDGKETDFAQLRGKVVYLLFWSSDAKAFNDQLNDFQNAESDFSKKEFAIVTVLCDKGIDVEKAKALVKEKKIKWPVYFDGTGEAVEFAAKLNVTAKRLPAGYLFDQRGILVKPYEEMKRVGGDVKKLLAVKK